MLGCIADMTVPVRVSGFEISLVDLGVKGLLGEGRAGLLGSGYRLEHAAHPLILPQHGLQVLLVGQRRPRPPGSFTSNGEQRNITLPNLRCSSGSGAPPAPARRCSSTVI